MNQAVCISAKTEQKIIAQYVREVNKEIIATHEQKRKLFDDLKNDIRARIADGKVANYEDIVTHFGTPEQVAKDFFATANIKEIKQKILIRRIVVAVVVTCIFAVLAYYGYQVWYVYDRTHLYTVENFEIDSNVVYEDKLVEDERHNNTESLPQNQNE
ncbi:MAG: hypothetical protein IJA31_05770 [Clostridia bacterium]|nr:hypothetical protein [Clostridia bacterium]